MTETDTRRRTRRLEVRTTSHERELIDRAVESNGGDLTAFVVVNVLAAARRVLADRETFVLNDGQRALWDDLNARPARALAGVRTLMERPSPFTS